jgi:diguanylate cyclase (GGDEF)-like protein
MSKAPEAAIPAERLFQALVESWPGAVALLPPDPSLPVWRNAAFRRMEGLTAVTPGLPPLLGGAQADPEARRAIEAARAKCRRVSTRVLLSQAKDDPGWLELEVLPLGDDTSAAWLGLLLLPSSGTTSSGTDEIRGQAVRMVDGLSLLARAGELLVLRRQGRQRGVDLCIALIAIDQRGPGQEELAHGVGEQLRQGLRLGDLLGRMPCGHFLLVLPGLRRGQALAVVERLLDNVEATEFETDAAVRSTTCSAGLALAEDSDATVDTMLQRAEAALERARAGGGGRAVVG